MKLTKRHKVFAVILVVGGAILIADRITSRDGEGTPPTASAATSPDTDDGPAAPDAARTPGTPASDLLADRLSALCRQRGLDAADVPGAFAPARAWYPQAPPEEMTVVRRPESVDLCREYKAAHRLTGVVVIPGGAWAIINDTCVAIGQQLDGFRLVSVTERAAVLVAGTSRVVLSLPATAVPEP